MDSGWHPRGPIVAFLGLVSGFFGGVAGNQGGLRAAALSAFRLSPGAFVATATATGLLVDAARAPVYLWKGVQPLLPASGRCSAVPWWGCSSAHFWASGCSSACPFVSSANSLVRRSGCWECGCCLVQPNQRMQLPRARWLWQPPRRRF